MNERSGQSSMSSEGHLTNSRDNRLTAFETCIGKGPELSGAALRINGELMDAHALQAEFAGFPASMLGQEGENALSLYMRLSYKHGGLVPQAMLPAALGLSKQRISQLVQGNRFATHKIGSITFVTGESLEAFIVQERKAGTTLKAPTFPQMVHAVKDVVRESVADRKKSKAA